MMTRNQKKAPDRDMVITRQTRVGGELVKMGQKVRLKAKDADLLERLGKAAEPETPEAKKAIAMAKEFPQARDADHVAILRMKADAEKSAGAQK